MRVVHRRFLPLRSCQRKVTVIDTNASLAPTTSASAPGDGPDAAPLTDAGAAAAGAGAGAGAASTPTGMSH